MCPYWILFSSYTTDRWQIQYTLLACLSPLGHFQQAKPRQACMGPLWGPYFRAHTTGPMHACLGFVLQCMYSVHTQYTICMLCIPAFELVNPWRACAARVTVIGNLSVCVCVCVSACARACVCVCLLSHTSTLEHLFVLKSMLRTQWALKVQNL